MTTHDITAPGDKERTLLDSETGERTTLPLYDTDHRRKVQVHLTLTLAEGWRRELLMAGGDPASDNATLVADALMRGLTGPWSLYAIDVAVDGR